MDSVLYYVQVAAAIALVVYSIILHEIAHGVAAFLLGDPTAKLQGRLTMNPVKHVDPFMTIAMPLLLLLMSGGRFLFGGAKPVPVNPYLFRDRRKGMMLTAVAGPGTNLLIMLTCVVFVRFLSLLAGVGPLSNLAYFLRRIFNLVGFWNVILIAFNLLPIPPLDGSRVVAYLLPRDLARSYEQLERYGMLLVLGVLLTGVHMPVIRYALDIYVVLVGIRVF